MLMWFLGSVKTELQDPFCLDEGALNSSWDARLIQETFRLSLQGPL